MLDLLARHGRLDLSVARDRRPSDRRASHRRGRRDLHRPGARSRRSATAPGSPATAHATVPMDEARAACAIDVSGRGLCVFEASLPPGAIGNFDHELTEEFFRALASEREADAAPHGPGRHECPPRDRGDVQGVRPGAARRRRDRPDRARRAEHEGNARMTRRSALVDYGMGNRRSVQKALEHVGAQVAVTGDRDVLRDCDGLVVPGVGAFPEAMSALACARARLSSSDPARAERHSAARHLPGHAAAVRALRRARADRRTRADPR